MTIAEIMRRTDVPVIAADERGYITALNDRFAAVYGWLAADLVGRPLSSIIPKQFHDAHHLGFSRFLSTGQPTILDQSLALNIATKDGREMPAEHFIVAERHDERWSFAATITPLGD